LLAGIIALGLAVIPSIALERPLPNPFGPDKKAEELAPEQPAQREGGLTLKFKKFSVNIGGKEPRKAPPVQPPKPPNQLTTDPIRWFTMSAAGCALAGIGFATVGQWREKHTILSSSAVCLCALALTWQYVVIGIVVGVVVVVVLLLISSMSA
jgi:hypothetical protein